jgi:hypothetical protein
MADRELMERTARYVRWILEHVEKFPKNQRYILAPKVAGTAMELLDLVIEAYFAARKRTLLERASAALEKLRIYVRMCTDMQMFSIGQYEYSSERLVQVGRLLGCWIRKEKGQEKGADVRKPSSSGRGLEQQ